MNQEETKQQDALLKGSGWRLALYIVLCETIGIVSGFLGNAGKSVWFDSLIKPSWNPPSYLFAPVWTTLYLLMGVSLWLIWKSTVAGSKQLPYFFFGLQLTLNFFWSILFFRLQASGAAFAEILLLDISIILCIYFFRRFSHLAAWLLLPYLLWVSFATTLNYAIWQLNS
ncbi:MAG: tryptophan-rich sensory protein [Chitinophagaceae bacterium]|nr:tryptophan-rich sensory protein [Chitinophagaceae bacterium]